MISTLEDNGNFITIDNIYIKKSNIREITHKPNSVIITCIDSKAYSLDISEFPTFGSTSELLDTILGYLNTATENSLTDCSISTSGGNSSTVLLGSDLGSYTFNAVGQTITFNGIKSINLEEVLIITNKTSGSIIYNSTNSEKGGSILDNILSLDFDTTSMSNDDILQIFIHYNNSQDFNLGALNVINRNPEWDHYLPVEHISVTNGSPNTYFIGIDMESYRHIMVQFNIDDITGSEFKFYSTLDENAAVPITGGSPGDTWHDKTTDFFKGEKTDDGTVGYIRDIMSTDTKIMPYKYLIAYTTQNVENTVDIWLRKY